MLEYLNANQATFWFALGATALIIELLVLGMSTIILFMVGLAGLLTGFLVYLGIVPENWGWGFACLGICTAIQVYCSGSPSNAIRTLIDLAQAIAQILSVWSSV